MAKEKGEVVGVVREWQPTHSTNLTNIQHQIDSWDRAPGDAPRPAPNRDYAAIEAAVDRITKRVKTRKVVVTETVTEYVDEEGPVEVQAASPSHVPEEANVPTTPVEETEGKKLGWFARRKQAKAEKAKAAEPTLTPVEPVMQAAPPHTVTIADGDDAWDPGTVRQVEPTKPLQSKAAKRTAAKKSSKKR